MRWPVKALGGMRATVIEEEDIQTVWDGLGKGIEEELEQSRIQIGPLPKEPLARGGGYGSVDREPCEDVWDEPHGLDAAGRYPAAAHRQQTEPAFVLAKHPDRAAVVGRDDVLQALPTRRLELSEGLRLLLCDWGAAL
jgi:hypothetical protein